MNIHCILLRNCDFVKMNGKMHSETGTFSPDGMRAEILNPFVHKLELDNTYDKIRVRINLIYSYLLSICYFYTGRKTK